MSDKLNPSQNPDKPEVLVNVPDGIGGTKASTIKLSGNNVHGVSEAGWYWSSALAVPARPLEMMADAALWLAVGNGLIRFLIVMPPLWSVLVALCSIGLFILALSLAAQYSQSAPHRVYRVALVVLALVLSYL
jgi:hypothetical protein